MTHTLDDIINNVSLVSELDTQELFTVDSLIKTKVNELRNKYKNTDIPIPTEIKTLYSTYHRILDIIFKKLTEYDDIVSDKPTATTNSTVNQQQPNTVDVYRGQHSAPSNESGSPIWNVCLNGIYPDDFYTRTREYVYMDSDRRGLQYVLDYRNKPNRQIRIFRSVPLSIEKPTINSGDWVTIDRAYAVQHGRENLNNNFKIIQKLVYARDVFTSGDSLSEWGYDPQPSVERRIKD